MISVRLNIHGVPVRVDTHAPRVAEDLRHDFHYFLVPDDAPPNDEEFTLTHLPESRRGDWGRGVRLGRSRLFRARRGVRRVAFFDRAFVEYAYAHRRAGLYCDSGGVAYEVVYLVVLAYCGEALDRRGVHRIHGLGLSWEGDGAVLLAPSGTGKSTLALALLDSSTPRLLSDDMPFVARGRDMLAFPQRIATREAPPVRSEYVRRFERVRYGAKYVVGSEYFHARIENRTRTRWLVMTRRDGSAEPRLRRLSRRRLLLPLLKWLVVGYETPQIWELFLRGDVGGKARILLRRLACAVSLWWGCEGFELVLSPHGDRNRKLVEDFPRIASCV